ncbi:ABC transporter substrate-binding protein [Bradyrhizobium ottawaense]|uniref:ABC transporter substrate-binding protein n=1 Tax=Bradyrhizobium ottawaense TaxID=931866 RepID=UPI0030C70844
MDDQAYASAAIDWKQFAGQAITLAGAIHPWSSAITPLLPDFTKLTGINVVTDFAPETTYLSAIPIRLARGSSTPDVCMFATYGQGISGGWLEPLNAYYSKKSLTDLVWYDERDLLKTARTFSLWPDGERYGFTITSEAMTLFLNSEMLAAKDLPAPQTFDELLATARAVKTDAISGIAMRAQAGGNSTPAAMAFVFSYGGAMIKDNRAAFASPEAIAAVDMYGRLLREAGPIGVGSYEWYQVLDDFLQGRTAMAIDSSNLRPTSPIQRRAMSPSRRGLQPFRISPAANPSPSCRTGRRASIPNQRTSRPLSCSCYGQRASRPRCGPQLRDWQRHGCRPGRARLSITHSAGKQPRQH